jgi:hypothetical protein
VASFLQLGWQVVKAVRTSPLTRSSVKTERCIDSVNFSVKYMALADRYPLKCGPRRGATWSPLVYTISPNVETEWLALLLPIRKVPGSNLDPKKNKSYTKMILGYLELPLYHFARLEY